MLFTAHRIVSVEGDQLKPVMLRGQMYLGYLDTEEHEADES